MRRIHGHRRTKTRPKQYRDHCRRRFDLVSIDTGIAGSQHHSVDAATPQEIGVRMYTNAFAPIRIARRVHQGRHAVRGLSIQAT